MRLSAGFLADHPAMLPLRGPDIGQAGRCRPDRGHLAGHTPVKIRPADSHGPPKDASTDMVLGALAPASPEPLPIVLLPGFEYRLREWRHPDNSQIYWRLERRKSSWHGEDDD
jgi:hypothetical protein